ncbi:ATP-binding protein (plasmid) [Streptomyces sp. R39]|uniref:ATP-binding protein n=1 Tax=Streptomyces sp. R39 TaxID=3238631 RepID=A0AB39R5J8_9ACTN
MPIPATTSARATCLSGEPLAHVDADLTGLDRPQEVARCLVRDILGDADESWAEGIVLVADELVGNAYRHVEASKPIEIAVDLYGWGAVVQVTDGGSDVNAIPRRPELPMLEAEGGRGLILVEALASSWFARPTAPGKAVVALFHHPSGVLR